MEDIVITPAYLAFPNNARVERVMVGAQTNNEIGIDIVNGLVCSHICLDTVRFG